MNKEITKIQKAMGKFFKGQDLELVETAIRLSYQIGIIETQEKYIQKLKENI